MVTAPSPPPPPCKVGKREFAARQEAGIVAVNRQDVGLGQDLQQVLGLQRRIAQSQIQIRAKQKDV